MHRATPALSDAFFTCPFCGLACDDLRLDGDPADEPRFTHACDLARQRLIEALAVSSGAPSIAGQPAELEQALDAVAAHLRASQAPLFAGLRTDVNGMRGLLALADHCSAVLDHAGGDAFMRNLLVMQDGGWITTTLTEVRNRADLIVMIGAECHLRFPRLIERVLSPEDALFCPPSERHFVLLGPWGNHPPPSGLDPTRTTLLPVERERIAGVAGLLRGLIAGRPVRADALAGVLPEALTTLAERLRQARYAVLVWSAAELDFPHAELSVQTLVELVRDLNRHGRAAALPLAGTGGDVTANQVCTWQTGYPLRTGLRREGPSHDPMLNRYQDLLACDECDLLLWVDALGQDPPPHTERPTLVLGRPDLRLGRAPEVFIPVGVPGVHHTGHLYRSDTVCPLPLRRIQASRLHSVAQVAERLLQRLRDTAEGGPQPC